MHRPCSDSYGVIKWRKLRERVTKLKKTIQKQITLKKIDCPKQDMENSHRNNCSSGLTLEKAISEKPLQALV